MNRWVQKLESHPVWTSAKNILEHLSVEFNDTGLECLAERQRILWFGKTLVETLRALDAEQTPFNQLDEINNQLGQVSQHTHQYSTNGEVLHLRSANDLLQKSLSELYILRAPTLPIGKQVKVNQLNEKIAEFFSAIDRKWEADKQKSTEIDQTLERQKTQLGNLESHIEKKDTELNNLISSWQNQFNNAQQAKQNEHNTAHQRREVAFNDLLKTTENNAKETVDELILERDAQLNSALDDIKATSDKFIVSLEKEFNDTEAYCQRKREEILELHQLVAGDSTTGGYAKTAKDERKQADYWRWATIVCIGVTAIWLVVVIVASNVFDGGSPDWGGYPIIASMTGVLLFGVGYAAKQSTWHRNNEKRNQNLALKLAALEPFISSLTPSQKIDLRSNVSKQIFGSGEPEAHSKDILDSTSVADR